ncbi:N-acetyl-gamma-glutamyl-phosphate reductase [Thermodesulfovibrionales bacterium]|nr:N-acetyl-gamma-glutamyl-phosphate reductase [Thermodesulfovibrionales bacterium]
MLRVAICGASGYVGVELLRILSYHPQVKVTVITSERSAEKRVVDLFPHLRKYAHLNYETLHKEIIIQKADLFFMALPHTVSQEAVDFFFKNGKKVVDLSADYRIADHSIYEEWYEAPHNYRETLKKAVYGLPEIHRGRIKKADLVANPGCYPTGAILGLYPAIKEGIIDVEGIIVDSKSGTSGAGRRAEVALSYCEVNEGFKAYGIAVHRHAPEIEQEITRIAKKEVKVNFTPHLVPMDRGIISTIYGKISKEIDTRDVIAIYKDSYKKEPFVNVLEENNFPNAKGIRGSNYCAIGLCVNKRTDTLIMVSAIDNLVKGASGQAVQNMNVMMGFKETTGLEQIALFP